MCDDDSEICHPVTQQWVQASPVIPTVASAEAQTEPQIQEHKLQTKKLQKKSAPDLQQAVNWQVDEVQQWMIMSNTIHFSCSLLECLRQEAVDGQVLLALTEEDVRDLRYKLGYKLTFGELKKFWLTVYQLQLQWKQEQQQQNRQLLNGVPYSINNNSAPPLVLGHMTQTSFASGNMFMPMSSGMSNAESCPCPQVPECHSFMADCDATHHKRMVPPEYFKTAVSLGYSFVVTWITSFVMVIVHERVPDMKRYPPLPDIFLDNVPHIPWAFNMCEITGSLLFTIWLIVLIFHKYRMALLRRFFALAGTVFLLRCVTMLITSLSVPGTHLQCNQKDFAIDDPNVDVFGALVIRMTRAYRIWSGLGMSIQGVRTCGDYMFSGHTVALTLLNFFITEYTPANLYFLHTLTWLLNMFGIFFILAAHEHYSIDVFVAFYITSRLFLYYHTLANNRALMQSDSTRTRIWFPMFSYFESSVDGMIPNEFDTPGSLIDAVFFQIMSVKDHIYMIAERYVVNKSSNSAKSSVHLFDKSEVDMRSHAQSSPPSNYLNSYQTRVDRLNDKNTVTTATSTHTSKTATTPQHQIKTSVDAAISPYASEIVKNDSRTSLTEKKLI